MNNPYCGKSFLEFFFLFFSRISKGHFFAFDEMQIVVLSAIAVSCSLLGTFLVLKRMAMAVNSLSHTLLLALVISFLLNLKRGEFFDCFHISFISMMVVSFLTAFLTFFLTFVFSRGFNLSEDASIGLVFTSLFAIGVILVSVFARNSRLTMQVLMGNVDIVSLEDIKFNFFVLGCNVIVIVLFFREFQMTSFDIFLARSFKIPSFVFNFFLILLASFTFVGAFKAVGIFLVLALLVGPTLTARLFCRSLKGVLIVSSTLGVLSSILAVALSRHFLSKYSFPLSTGALLVVIISCVFLLSFYIKVFYEKNRCFRKYRLGR